MTLENLKQIFQKEAGEKYTESEIQELFLIFCDKILGLNRMEIRKNGGKGIGIEEEKRFLEVISQLKTGKPYQQILGETEFYGLRFFVDENVLIPRPETEELVDLIIKKIQEARIKNQNPSSKSLKILDIGTGSGIIPIILKKYFPNAEISALDFSEKALETAKKNADFHQVEINFIHQNYISEDLNETFDLIVSNPPYIGTDEEDEIAASVKDFEPKMALFSPSSDALIFYRKIAEDAENHLNENGMVFLEINQKLGTQTLDLFKKMKSTELLKDLSGNDRFIIAVK